MSAMKNVLAYAAAAWVLTGLALLIAPSLVGWLLLGDALVGIAVPVARVAGIALIGLGIACWPAPPRAGMSTYGGGVSLYLAYLAFAGSAGILLWPAGALHLLLTVLLTAERLATKRKGIRHRAIHYRAASASAEQSIQNTATSTPNIVST